jgi:putative addiction module component (TIGR02574 family)
VATIDELRERAMRLPEDEREQLALELLESLDGSGATSEEIEKARSAELRRRLDDIHSGSAQLLSEEDAMKIFES